MNMTDRSSQLAQPRLGLLGVGWCGLERIVALSQRSELKIAAVADHDVRALSQAAHLVPGTLLLRGLDELLACDLDGVVIASANTSHTDHAIKALEHGLAVFCQTPLACTSKETEAVLATAKATDRLLGVDFCYRHLAGLDTVREQIRDGEFGELIFVDLIFHNGYGPGKSWQADASRSGGGCVIDLGGHLVDLALWLLDWPTIEATRCRRVANGRALAPDDRTVEDFAHAELQSSAGTSIRLACSWRAHTGCPARIEAVLHGTRGGVCIRNIDGSFYDFLIERCRGTRRDVVSSAPDPWPERAISNWARRLAISRRFDSESLNYLETARVIDALYGRSPEALVR